MSNMVIKLKMPEKAPFECPTCGKAFTTERGLGSHKKVHMEKKKKRNHETMELENEETGEKTLGFSCPVCPQSFASEKALHGHMRKHSNRGWRGMKPPPPVEGGPSNPEAVSVALSGGQSATVTEEKVYLCDSCGMVFRSYQALGGHKSHRGCDGQPSVNKAAADVGPGPSSLAFEFDLNELPVPERE